MKSLDQYPTPETDELVKALIETRGMSNAVFTAEITSKCEMLEQRLAACRDALLEIGDRSASSNARRTATATLILTTL